MGLTPLSQSARSDHANGGEADDCSGHNAIARSPMPLAIGTARSDCDAQPALAAALTRTGSVAPPLARRLPPSPPQRCPLAFVG